eukprot:9634003-Alexandrium_andersonii.AAC.1
MCARAAHTLCAQLRAARAGQPDITARLSMLWHVRARARRTLRAVSRGPSWPARYHGVLVQSSGTCVPAH